MTEDRIKKVKMYFDAAGPVLRYTDLKKQKLCSKDIAELVALGHIRKIRTGSYIWKETAERLTELEFAVSAIPNAVICMLSAAVYYDLTTVNPLSIDIAIPAKGLPPVLPEYPPIKLYLCIQKIYEIGITEIALENCNVKIYDKERTVCDFFRLRSEIGEDIMLEVLKNYMSGHKNIQRLYEYATLLRIKAKIRPYVEALL